jgi:hypothetical protein
MRGAAIAFASFFLIASQNGVFAAETAPVPGPQKLKGTIESFAAPVLTVKTAKGESHTIKIAPEARIVTNEKIDITKIKAGDFVATTSAAGKDGRLEALDVRLFPETLHGLGEGQYPYDNGSKSLTNGAVMGLTAAPKGKSTVMKLSFHGSTPGPNGMCSGHAPGPGLGPCASDTEIVVTPKTLILSWVLGDTSWLETGKTVSLYTVPDTGGKEVTYGVVVEHNGVKPLP